MRLKNTNAVWAGADALALFLSMEQQQTFAQTVAEKIREIIKQSNDCRTDKRKLVANFLAGEMKEAGINRRATSCLDFLKMYSEGKFTEIETITRIHREVVRQLDEEEKKIHDTKPEEQEKVKTDLKSLNDGKNVA